MNTSNPFSHFIPITPQTLSVLQNSMGQSRTTNFNRGFEENTVILPKTNFTNLNNTLHNNLGNSVFGEEIDLYTIFADGFYRNHSVYKNPFDFVIQLDGAGSGYINVWEDQLDTSNPTKPTYNKVLKQVSYDGDPGVVLGRKKCNVKSIKLKHVICPKFNRFYYGQVINGVPINDFTYDILSPDDYNIDYLKRFIILKVKELSDDRVFSAGSFYGSDSFALKIDQCMGNFHNKWCPFDRHTVLYKNSSLANISKFSIKLYDDLDNLLKIPQISYTEFKNTGEFPVTKNFIFDDEIELLNNLIIQINNGITPVINPYTGTQNNITDINNTISQIQIVKKRHQIQVVFSIKIYENELNTQIKYDK